MSNTRVSEQDILEALRQVPQPQWDEIFAFVCGLRATNGVPIAAYDVPALADSVWTAAELQRLPRVVQDAVLQEQASRLVTAYGANPDFVASNWWKGSELSYLRMEQGDIILEASAIVAEEEYRTNPELNFDAYGEDDLVDEHPDPASR